MKPVALLTISFCLAGCQSLDTYLTPSKGGSERVLVPEIKGVLTQGGQAVEGTEIVLSRDEGRFSRCEEPVASTQASADGGFSFEAITTAYSASQIFTQIENEWTVCANIEGESKLLWYDRHAGVKFEGSIQRINCDLDRVGSARQLVCIPDG